MATTQDATTTEEKKVTLKAPSPELLERLAKAREAAAEKRKKISEQKKLAQGYIEGEKPKLAQPAQNEPELAQPAQPAQPEQPAPPRTKKKKQVLESSDSDSESYNSSTDSSDTSDSEVDSRKNRRSKKKKIKSRAKLKLELEKAKEKYKNRYKTRYELLATRGTSPPSPPQQQRAPVQSVSNAQLVKDNSEKLLRKDVQQAVHREMIASTLKNLFGS